MPVAAEHPGPPRCACRAVGIIADTVAEAWVSSVELLAVVMPALP